MRSATRYNVAAANDDPTSPSRPGDDGYRIASRISETPRSVRTTCATHGARNPSTISNRSPDGSGRASGARGAAGGGKFPEVAAARLQTGAQGRGTPSNVGPTRTST